MTLAGALGAVIQAVLGGLILVSVAAVMLKICRCSAALRADVWFGVLAAVTLLPILDAAAQRLPHASPFVAPVASVPASISGLALAALALVLAAAGALAAVVVSYAALARLRRRTLAAPAYVAADAAEAARTIGFRGSFDVRIGSAAHSPLALGVLRPTIVLPASALGLATRERELVVMHELAHLKRRDPLVHALARGMVALAAFNPAAYLAARALEHDRELACDDVVMHATHERRAYARALARYLGIEIRLPAAVLGLLAQPAFALRRMRHVLAGRSAGGASRARRFAFASSAALLAGGTFFWGDTTPLVRFVVNAIPAAREYRAAPVLAAAPVRSRLRFLPPPALRTADVAVPRFGRSALLDASNALPVIDTSLPRPRVAPIGITTSSSFTPIALRRVLPSTRTVAEIVRPTLSPSGPAGTTALPDVAAAPTASRAFVADLPHDENIRARAVGFTFAVGGAMLRSSGAASASAAASEAQRLQYAGIVRGSTVATTRRGGSH